MKLIYLKNSNSIEVNQQIDIFASEMINSEASVSVATLDSELTAVGLYNGVKYLKYSTSRFLNRLRAALNIIFNNYQIVHVFGEKSLWPVFLAKLLKPKLKIILTLDSSDLHADTILGISRQKTLRRMAHQILTTREIDLRHQDLNSLNLEYLPHPIYPKRLAFDSLILKAHRLNAQNYILALVDPINLQEISDLINIWQNVLMPNMGTTKLAIGFTKSARKQDLALDPSIVWLGYLKGETADMLFTGARAVLLPNLRNYHYTALEAFSYGKMIYPVQELRDNSAILYYDMHSYLGDLDISLHQLNDPVQCMSFGHLVRESAEIKHNPKSTIHKLENIYDQALMSGEFRTVNG
jgi:hypothetical protein